MLTPEDFLIINDQDYLIHKRAVLSKISQILSEVEVTIKNSPVIRSPLLPQDALTMSGKISRGENYKGLPYVVLDFPRYSNGEKVFLYRTMFWWGHYFICLLISQNCGHQIKKSRRVNDLLLNTGSTPWNYDLSDSCWKELEDSQTTNSKLPFICIGKRIDFNDFNLLSDISLTTFDTALSFLMKKN